MISNESRLLMSESLQEEIDLEQEISEDIKTATLISKSGLDNLIFSSVPISILSKPKKIKFVLLCRRQDALNLILFLNSESADRSCYEQIIFEGGKKFFIDLTRKTLVDVMMSEKSDSAMCTCTLGFKNIHSANT